VIFRQAKSIAWFLKGALDLTQAWAIENLTEELQGFKISLLVSETCLKLWQLKNRIRYSSSL